MAQQNAPPWGSNEAVAWLQNNIDTPFRDAALLHTINLKPHEKDILVVGGADATLAVSIFHVLEQQGGGIPRIVTVDNCEYMVERANMRLNAMAAVGNPTTRSSVTARNLDATSLDSPTARQAMRNLFPTGISVILCINVFHTLASPNTQRTYRDLMALLKPGGRLIFTAAPHGSAQAAVHIYNMQPRRLSGIVNIAPPDFKQMGLQQVHLASVGIAGVASGGEQVSVRDVDCRWLSDTWQQFCQTPTVPAGLETAIVNSQLRFSPSTQAYFHSAAPPVRYGDSSEVFIHRAVQQCPTPSLDALVNGVPSTLTRIAMASTAYGFVRLQNDIAAAFGAIDRSRPAAQHLITANSNDIVEQHGLDPDRPQNMSVGLVLVSIVRQNN